MFDVAPLGRAWAGYGGQHGTNYGAAMHTVAGVGMLVASFANIAE